MVGSRTSRLMRLKGEVRGLALETKNGERVTQALCMALWHAVQELEEEFEELERDLKDGE